jgi:undecaprenyl-diphosphatase
MRESIIFGDAMIQRISEFDKAAVLYINNRLRTRLLDYFFIGATYLGSDVFALGVILGLFFFPGRNFNSFAAAAALSLFFTSITVGVVKFFVKRKRPFEKLINLNSIKIGVDQFSFPSGHTAAAFTLAATVALLTSSPLISFIYYMLATLVAMSRVYLGVHYPSDVAAGAVVGTSYAVVVHFMILGRV